MKLTPDVLAWQRGTGPAPKGYGIRCTGCSRCVLDGHLPMLKPGMIDGIRIIDLGEDLPKPKNS